MRLCECSREKLVLLLLVSVVGVSVGCETYQPHALNSESYQEVWRERSDNDETMMRFIQEMSTQRGRSDLSFNIEDGLTCEESEWVTLTYNPALRVARKRLGIAAVRVEERGKWEDPDLDFDVLRFVDDVPDRWLSGVSVTFTLPISGRLEAAQKQVAAEYRQKLMEVYQEENEIRSTLRDVWVQWVMNDKRLEVARSYLALLEDMENRFDELLKVGEADVGEVGLIKIDRLNQSLIVKELERQDELHKLQLKRLMGLTPESDVKLIQTMPSEPQQADDVVLHEVNPELQVYKAQYDVAEKTLLREVKKQYPDLKLGPSYENEEGQSRIGLTGGIPLPILNANIEEIRVARAERELARAIYEQKHEAVHAVYARLKLQRAGLSQQIATSESELLPLIDRQQKQIQALIQQGEVSLLVLIQSEKQVYESKLRLIGKYEKLRLIDHQLALLRGDGVYPKTQPSTSEVKP